MKPSTCLLRTMVYGTIALVLLALLPAVYGNSIRSRRPLYEDADLEALPWEYPEQDYDQMRDYPEAFWFLNKRGGATTNDKNAQEMVRAIKQHNYLASVGK